MSEVLVKVEGISRKFCRNLKRSLWYGVQDIAAELNPFASRRTGVNGQVSGDSRLPYPAGETHLRPDEFWAVNDVSFELRRGECLGLIGRNGAGKTTLLKMLNSLIKPDKGRIEMRGRVGALIALGAGFNPILTGRENIYVNGSVLGLTKREIDKKIADIIDFAEIGDFIDSPVQSYSSGMQVRLGFAIATALEPDVLLLDEVLAVGDQAFATKCFQRVGVLIERCCVIFVSHNEAQVARICDRCLLLNNGSPISLGPTQDCLAKYREINNPCGELIVTTHPHITDFKSAARSTSSEWGGALTATISYTVQQAVEFGEVVLSLRQNGLSVIQGILPDNTFSGMVGRHTYNLKIEPVHARSGKYSLALYAITPSKKSTLIHALEFCEVTISGPNGYGPIYQAPISCETLESSSF
jgi:ABC-type polysaccharide/polyol phosphate transport system ATPase subunit